MSIDLSKLDALPIEEVRVLAGQMGIQAHHKTGKEKLVNMIKEAALTPAKPQVEQSMEHVAAKPVEPVITNTPEMVLEAIKDITDKKPDFQALFPNDGTWIFKCKGAEESGNLSIPLRVIKMKAQSVSRGRMAPQSINHMGFDNMVTAPNSAYTNVVLG